MYNLPTTVDSDKIFLINFSDLKDRYDPYFFKGEFSLLRKYLEDKGFIRFGSLIKSWNRGDGPRDGYYTDDSEAGVPFLRINNLNDNSIDLKDVKFINRIIHETKLKRTQVKGGNLVFAISGTKENLGTVSIIPNDINEANLNSALVRLDLDEEKISNEFVCLLFDLQITRTQIEFTGKGAAQNNLNNKEISSILVPNISLKDQSFLVAKLREAKLQTRRKEAEAKALLASIDTYLLGELGISLPEQDNSLEKRIFTSRYSELGGRMDSVYFITKHYKVEGGRYENKKLKHLANIGKGQSITKDKVTEGEFPVIAGGQTSPYNHNEYNHKGNIITVSASGAYSGFVWYHDYPIFASDCCVIKSKIETAISTLFLSEILKLKQKEIYFLQQGAGQPHVYASDLAELQIPIPSPDKQEELLNHIQNIRSQAKSLQHEAARVLEEAKREVEKMILGK